MTKKYICSKKDCTGCFACVNICPKNAIKMKEDKLGFIYPEIDNESCIDCNICEKNCPQRNNIKSNKPFKCYAAHHKIDAKRKTSSSGGIATTLYEHIIKAGGVVYGVDSTYENDIHFIKVSDLDSIKKLKGSKYVHAYIKDAYKSIKHDLNEQKKVLFIGTPCQVAGLKQFLKKEFENLYLIDIICHGVPSQLMLKEELKKNNIDIENKKICFRDENGFYLSVHSNKNEIFNIESQDSEYYRNFLDGHIYRENCYNCKYANENRISDITIGDFWGLSNDSKLKKTEKKGISAVLINTLKGQTIFEEIKDDIIYEERTVDEAIAGNTQLRHPVKRTSKRTKFEKVYQTHGYKKAMHSIESLKPKLKRIKFIRKVYELLKKGDKNG